MFTHLTLNDLMTFDPMTTTTVFRWSVRLHTPMFTHLTLDDPWWPWSDLQNFRHQQSTPPTKFQVHKPMFTPFDLIWPWMTPHDLEVTFKIFNINNWPHPPSFMSIDQCLPHLTLDDPWWPWSDLQNFRHRQLTPPTKFHVHTPIFKKWNNLRCFLHKLCKLPT